MYSQNQSGVKKSLFGVYFIGKKWAIETPEIIRVLILKFWRGKIHWSGSEINGRVGPNRDLPIFTVPMRSGFPISVVHGGRPIT